MIGNIRIIKHIANEENCKRLEELIEADFSEYRQIRDYDYGKRIRKKKDAIPLIAQGKPLVDNFLGIDAKENIPEIEVCRNLEFKAAGLYSSIVSNGLMLGGGITLGAYFSQPIIGGFMAGIGLLKLLMIASLKLKFVNSHYDKGTIFCTKTREKKMLFDVIHEYSHMVSENIFGNFMGSWLLSEGFAEGVSIYIARESGNPALKKAGLSRSIEMMDYAKSGIRKKLAGKDIFEDANKQQENGKIKVIESTGFAMLGCGYSMFRFAEEKHGSEVYRDVLKGDFSRLLD